MIKALVACQDEGCAEEVTYELDMVRMFEGHPICQVCWEVQDHAGHWPWYDLPQVTVKDLE